MWWRGYFDSDFRRHSVGANTVLVQGLNVLDPTNGLPLPPAGTGPFTQGDILILDWSGAGLEREDSTIF